VSDVFIIRGKEVKKGVKKVQGYTLMEEKIIFNKCPRLKEGGKLRNI